MQSSWPTRAITIWGWRTPAALPPPRSPCDARKLCRAAMLWAAGAPAPQSSRASPLLRAPPRACAPRAAWPRPHPGLAATAPTRCRAPAPPPSPAAGFAPGAFSVRAQGTRSRGAGRNCPAPRGRLPFCFPIPWGHLAQQAAGPLPGGKGCCAPAASAPDSGTAASAPPHPPWCSALPNLGWPDPPPFRQPAATFSPAGVCTGIYT